MDRILSELLFLDNDIAITVQSATYSTTPLFAASPVSIALTKQLSKYYNTIYLGMAGTCRPSTSMRDRLPSQVRQFFEIDDFWAGDYARLSAAGSWLVLLSSSGSEEFFETYGTAVPDRANSTRLAFTVEGDTIGTNTFDVVMSDPPDGP